MQCIVEEEDEGPGGEGGGGEGAPSGGSGCATEGQAVPTQMLAWLPKMNYANVDQLPGNVSLAAVTRNALAAGHGFCLY